MQLIEDPSIDKPHAEPAEWNDRTARELRFCVVGGWSTHQCTSFFQQPAKTIDYWKTLLRKQHKEELNLTSDDFLADCDGFFQLLEQRSIRALASASLTATQEGSLIKQAREAREARIKIRKDTGRIKVTGSGERDPSKMSDAEVDEELKALDGKITRLAPRKPKKKASG